MSQKNIRPILGGTPEHISQDELAYLLKCIQGAAEAEQLEREAERFEREALQRRQQAMVLRGARDFMIGHLFEKYDLDTRADSIDTDTREIRRGSRFPEMVTEASAPPGEAQG